MPISMNGSSCMPPSCRGRPRRCRASSVACSIAWVTRSPGRRRSCGMPRRVLPPARPCGRRGVLRPRRHLPGRAWRLPCGQLHPQFIGIEAHAQIRIRLHDFRKALAVRSGRPQARTHRHQQDDVHFGCRASRCGNHAAFSRRARGCAARAMGGGCNNCARRIGRNGDPRARGIVLRGRRGVRAAIVAPATEVLRRSGQSRGEGCAGLDQARSPRQDAAGASMMCTVAPHISWLTKVRHYEEVARCSIPTDSPTFLLFRS